MATNADFNALIARITTATNTLEADVITITEGSTDIAEAVAAAKLAETNTKTAASNAAAQVPLAAGQVTLAANQVTLAAGQVTLAAGQVTLATTQANTASSAATTATTQANRAQNIADNLLATAPFQEAPTDGGIYGRQNAGWALVDTGGATPVTAVNGETPDAQGNVTIAIPDTTSDLTNDSGFITVADIPAVPVGEAPTDGKQYARQDAGWSEVVSSGGGGGAWPAPFTDESNNLISLNGGATYVPWTQWQYANPFRSQPFNNLQRTVAPVVNITAGYNAYFTNINNMSQLPAGKYYFGTQDFKSAVGGAALSGQSGVITIEQYADGAFSKRAWAVSFTTTGTIGGMYVWRTSGVWFPVGTQTA